MISNELKHHLEATVEKLASIGISVAEKKELPYGIQLTLSGNETSCKINLYHSRKKGNSVVQAGGDKSLLNVIFKQRSSTLEPTVSIPQGIRAGSDEAGKGEYFGPLVAAAVACDQSTARKLVELGVADSKKLSAGKIRELYEKITIMGDVKYAVCSILPREYNRLFSVFQQKKRNSLDILAMTHGKAFKQLLSDGTDPGYIVIDKFCEMGRLRPWLPELAAEVELRVRAEDSEPSVAAASIIARSVYLDELARLSSSCGVNLKPGAGAGVDAIGRTLVALKGEAILLDTAKVHFANTGKITRRP